MLGCSLRNEAELREDPFAPLVHDLVERRDHNERKKRRRNDAADNRTSERGTEFRALTPAERNGNHSGNERERRHHDRAQTNRASLNDRFTPRQTVFIRAHFAKSMSRIAFFATIPINRMTPMRLMMLIVEPVIISASITPIERQRQRDQNREWLEERTELKHENQVHQHHCDAERGEDSAEHFVLAVDFSALREPHSRRKRQLVDARIDVLHHLDRVIYRRVSFDVDDEIAVEVRDLRGTKTLSRSLRSVRVASLSATGRVVDDERKLLEIRDTLARFRLKSNVYLTSSPVGSSQSPALIPANAGRSDCAT